VIQAQGTEQKFCGNLKKIQSKIWEKKKFHRIKIYQLIMIKTDELIFNYSSLHQCGAISYFHSI